MARDALVARLVIGAVVVAVGVELVRVGAGVSGVELATSWQLLDLQLLADNPLRAVWHLHTQPPLHNAVVGIVAWSPLPLAGTMSLLYLANLLAVGWLAHDLSRRWAVPAVVATVVGAWAVINPALLSTVRIASYEVPLAALVLALVWCVDRYSAAPTPRRLAAIVGVATALTLTRTLFHPVWLAVVLGVVLVARRPPRRQMLWAAAVPLVLIGAVSLKNEILVGSASLSSWSGFNLQRGVVAPLPADVVAAAVADGAVTPLALERPWLAYAEYVEGLGGCVAPDDDPALAAAVKLVPTADFDVPNFNHVCYVPLYEESRANAIELVRRAPGEYLRMRGAALAVSFGHSPIGFDDPSGFIGSRPPPRTWMDDVYETLVPLHHVQIDMTRWNVPLVEGVPALPVDLAWPVVVMTAGVVVGGLLAIARRRRVRRVGGPTTLGWTVALLTIGVVIGVGDLVELGENGRFRTTVDPLVLVCFTALATSSIRGLRSWWSARDA